MLAPIQIDDYSSALVAITVHLPQPFRRSSYLSLLSIYFVLLALSLFAAYNLSRNLILFSIKTY